MPNTESISNDHPLRKLFRSSLEYGLIHRLVESNEVLRYIEEHILYAFVNADNLFKIRNRNQELIDDIADMLAEGNVLLNAQSFPKEFEVHKHIGDYTLFMLGMFPDALAKKRGKEFVLGSIVVPGASLSEHYMLQGPRSYEIASELANKDIFAELAAELAKNFNLYIGLLELARIFLDHGGSKQWLNVKNIIIGGNN